MRVLLLSAYAAVSHRYWAESLMDQLPDIEWTLLELPPRYFSWRIRGNPLTWMLSEHATLSRRYDVVLATSMVDVATLTGLYPHLGQARRIVYFHENQFAYPESLQQQPQVEAKMVNLYSALAADEVVFNTAYNRDAFVTGVRAFLKRLPEKLPIAERLDALKARARVLPVPLLPFSTLAGSPPNTAARVAGRIIWNHRWEYDKNPEDFFAALMALSEAGVSFELAVMGQRFRQLPPIFATARERLAAHIVAWGPQPQAEYQALLDSGDIVVSTTWHEFQGLAIMEAAQRGALPLVPDRLCFPELYGGAYRYDGTRAGLEKTLRTWLEAPASRPGVMPTMAWEWPQWRSAYRALLTGTGEASRTVSQR